MNVETLLETTLALTAAVLVVLALRRPLRALFGAAAAYAAWALAPAALLAVLLPAAVEPSAPARMVAGMGLVNPGPVAAIPAGPDAVDWWMVAWVAGVLASALVFSFRQHRFRRALGTLQRRPDGLVQADAAAGLPAVLGWPARIVLPADFEVRYAPAEQALVLCHERVHLRRGDVPASAVAAALRCLFWFNPLIHLATTVFRQDQELACDAAVLRQFPGSRRTYADALLKTQLADEPLPVGCHWFGSHPLKERIAMLKRPLPSTTRWIGGLAAATVLTLAGAMVAWAAQPPVTGVATEGQLLLEVEVAIDGGEPQSARAVVNPGEPHTFAFNGNGQRWDLEMAVSNRADGQFELVSTITRDGELFGEPRLWFDGKGARVAIGEGEGSRPGRVTKGIEAMIRTTRGGEEAATAAAAGGPAPARTEAAPGEQPATADTVLTPGFDRIETPKYPPASLAAGEGGTVFLRVLVAADGSPLRVEYDADGSTLAADSPLAIAARESMARSTFLPARKDGKPVEAWMRLPIRFEPEGGPDGTKEGGPESDPEVDLRVRG